jgi:hypothetical protein
MSGKADPLLAKLDSSKAVLILADAEDI